MTGGAAAAIAAGLLIMVGLVAVVRGVRRSVPRAQTHRAESLGEVWQRVTRRPPGPRGRRRDVILLVSVLVGFLVAALTGWVIAIVLAPVVAVGLPYLLVVPKQRDVKLLEALDRWVRALSATLATGKSITDAIRISRRTAPPLLAEEIGVLVARLNNRWETRDALMRFADAIDSPDADGVVAALILAANRGANGASVTLQALADSIQAQLKGRRTIEVERAKPYVVVRQVTVITMITLIGVFVMSPTFFDPYRTPLGQGLLSALLIMYFGFVAVDAPQGPPAQRPRILVGQYAMTTSLVLLSGMLVAGGLAMPDRRLRPAHPASGCRPRPDQCRRGRTGRPHDAGPVTQPIGTPGCIRSTGSPDLACPDGSAQRSACRTSRLPSSTPTRR